MNNETKNDMNRANIAIQNKVIPILKTYPNFKDCEFICLENLDNNIATMFDINCGFDWFIKSDFGLRGLAARCQQATERKWRTFTIRKNRPSGSKTELIKRKDAIKNGYIYPYYTLQAYLKGDWNTDCEYFGLCRTKDIYNNLDKIETRTLKNPDGVTFLAIDWQSLIDISVKVAIHPKQ